MVDTPANPQWLEDWQRMSRQYWDGWTDLAGKNPGLATGVASSPPWHEGLEQWARLYAGSGNHGDVAERMLSNAKTYLDMLQNLSALASGKMPDMGATAWTDALKNGMNIPGGNASMFSNPMMNGPMAGPWNDLSGSGAKGFDQMMAQFTQTIAPMVEAAKRGFDMPAFGYQREQQEHMQKTAKALFEYQQQNARYNALMLKASQRGFDILQSKLAAREEPGRQIDSVKALYDLWVDAAEEGYAEIALSPEFREVYGELVNAQMRARTHIQASVERYCNDLGMPTRGEIDSIGKRLQELRREVRRNGEATGDSNGLADELAALRRELAELKSARTITATSANPTKPAVAAKKEMTKTTKRKKLVATRAANQAGEKSPAKRSAAKKKPASRKAKRKAESTPPPAGNVEAGTFAARVAEFARASKGSKARPSKGKADKSARTGKSAKSKSNKR
ncbi:MAG: class III poly(R)-hydroxyalkanoic acid synthase subunit PhaE [Dokdonella sp.]